MNRGAVRVLFRAGRHTRQATPIRSVPCNGMATSRSCGEFQDASAFIGINAGAALIADWTDRETDGDH